MTGIKRIERSALFIPITSCQGACHDILPIGCSQLHFLYIRTIYKHCPFLTPSPNKSLFQVSILFIVQMTAYGSRIVRIAGIGRDAVSAALGKNGGI